MRRNKEQGKKMKKGEKERGIGCAGRRVLKGRPGIRKQKKRMGKKK